MNSYFKISILFAVTLSGCASHSYCLSKQNYDGAKSIKPIEGVDGLKLPESPAALRVPDTTTNDSPYGVLVPDSQHKGKKVAQCLDQPPAFIPPPPTEDSAPEKKT